MWTWNPNPQIFSVVAVDIPRLDYSVVSDDFDFNCVSIREQRKGSVDSTNIKESAIIESLEIELHRGLF